MSAPTATVESQKNAHIVATLEANEWGQIVGLEPKATYFVIRRPTAELTREKSRELTQNIRTFLQEQRVVTEKQMQELNEKYGTPAKAKAQELRATLEQRFDNVAKEVETKFSELETKFGDRVPMIKRSGTTASPDQGETPGEMPTGESAATTATPAKKKPSSGSNSKKSE